MINDTDDQPGGEIHRARCGRVPSTELCPQEIGVCHTLAMDAFPNPEFLWRLHHLGIIDYELIVQPISFSLEDGCRMENSKLLILA